MPRRVARRGEAWRGVARGVARGAVQCSARAAVRGAVNGAVNGRGVPPRCRPRCRPRCHPRCRPRCRPSCRPRCRLHLEPVEVHAARVAEAAELGGVQALRLAACDRAEGGEQRGLVRHGTAQLLELGRHPPGRMGLQPLLHGVAAAATWGCSLRYTGLQPPLHGVAASATWGCSLASAWARRTCRGRR